MPETDVTLTMPVAIARLIQRGLGKLPAEESMNAILSIDEAIRRNQQQGVNIVNPDDPGVRHPPQKETPVAAAVKTVAKRGKKA